MELKHAGQRVAVVDGLRTPFAKQGTAYKHLSAIELGKLCVAELMQRCGLEPTEVQKVVYGQVVPSVEAHNIAREVVLGVGMPADIEAYSVSRACATSYQSAVDVADAIVAGDIDCGLAGGADSMSDVPITMPKKLAEALLDASRAKSVVDRMQAFSGLAPRDLVPQPPALREPSTGMTMGESAEKMAKDNGIAREPQDEFAHRSHTLAARAWEQGIFEDDVMRVYVPPAYEEVVVEDNLVRKDSQLDAYEKLPPVFDRRHGTVTAGNSTALTDGAGALLMMREDKARALGLDVLGFIRSYAFTAVDPADQMLIGPVYAMPRALERAGAELADMDVLDMHEAFSAQMLSVIQRLESDAFGREELGRKGKVGEIDWDKLNAHGGSIALGHPFAATGARQISQTLRELRRRGGGLGLCSACAAGGLAAAAVLEAA